METETVLCQMNVENTPNPSTMKFVANKNLATENSTYEYTDMDQTQESPLATQLFNFPFVKSVFISSNYIAITKGAEVDWDEVSMDISEFIQDYLNSGKAIFSNACCASHSTNGQTKTDHIEPNSEIEQKIVSILEQYVRPAVEGDGGAIHFKSYEDGVVTVILKGACSGCPSASYTLKAGVENLLVRMVPEVKEVVAEQF